MYYKGTIAIIRYILVFCVCFLHASFTLGQAKFIPNLGQWDDPSQYRSDLAGGSIFMLKNQIRYNFIDNRDIEVLHKDPFKPEYNINGQAIFLEWLNASPNPGIVSKNEYPEYYNFYMSHNESGWRSGVHAYSQLNYTNLYAHINMEISGEGNDLKYTYTVLPGGKPADIKIKIDGGNDVFLENEDLQISTSLGLITEKSPYAYQWVGDDKVAVACKFKLKGNVAGFDFPDGYDKSRTLVIDPLVIFATYSGSKADNFGFTATYDTAGNGYSGGDVFAGGFPTTPGAYQISFKGGTYYYNHSAIDMEVLGSKARDVAILKYTPDGKSLIFATYLGGAKGNEQPHSMVVDKDNNLIVFGTTASSDFPVTKNAYDTSFNGKTDLFITKFSYDGKKLLSSTFIGGSGYDGLNGINTYTWTFDPNGVLTSEHIDGMGKLGYNYGDQFRGEVIVDSNKNVYVATTTMSGNFPTTSGSYQPSFGAGTQDGCVFKMDSTLGHLVWSTYLGGSKEDAAYSIQLDKQNNVFVCGGTLSPYFFPNGSSFQKYLAGGIDGYVCHIKNDGSGIISATYLGTSSYDQPYFVQLDNSENVYLYGQTESPSFLVQNVIYSNPKSGNFITKFNNSLDNVIFSTVVGSGKSQPDISPTAFLVDKCERIYISGWGGALWPNFSPMKPMYGMPITPDAYQKKTADSGDFYVSVFERNMDTLLYASYFGGKQSIEHVDGGTSRFDKNGIIYQSVCGGCGGHSDFPTTPGAWSRTNKSIYPRPNCNNLLFKVDLQIPTLKAGFIAPQFGCLNVTLNFKNISKKAKKYTWDFGDGSPASTSDTPTHYYQVPGNYQVTLIAYNPTSCKVYDTFKSNVTIYKNAKANFDIKNQLCSKTVNFIQTGMSNTTSWDFGDGAHSNIYNGTHTYSSGGIYKVKLLVDSGTSCVDTFTKILNITAPKADFSMEYQPCTPQIIKFTNLSTGVLKSRKWWFPFATTDTTKDPTFNFTAKGRYEISLVVMDSNGCKDSIKKAIMVSTKPEADFIIKADTCSFLGFFKNTSISTKNVHWILSDGSVSDLDSVNHTFPGIGTYTITLIADPGLPCADTIKKTLTFAPTTAKYTFTVDTCTGLVRFTDKSTGQKSWLWKFTPNDSSTLQNPSFVFKNKGQFNVKLTVKSSAGCRDSFVQSIAMPLDVSRLVHIPNIFTPNGDLLNNKFVVDGLSPCYSNEIWIYNRWGQELFHESGNELIWDGYVYGNLVPEGVYYYVFHGHPQGTLTGTISVVY